MNNGFRVYPNGPRPSQHLIRLAAEVPVANISDCMSRMSSAGAALRPLHGGRRLTGGAVTVRTRPGDNLLVHKALDMAASGDVIVVDAGGDLSNAIIGEIMVRYALSRHIAGFVIDGAVRDSEAIVAMGMPVYAAGITHRGPYKDGPGELNVPVAVGGMTVFPGDLVVGDGDGVVALPLGEAEAILAAATLKQQSEASDFEQIERGTWARNWVDQTLASRGCEILPDAWTQRS